jgi:beta-lactamase superfamily II metal-dependent hydrolase
VTTVTHIAALPGARVVIAPPPWPAVIVDFALVGLAAFLLWRKYPRSAAIAIACGIACVIFAPRTLPQQSARITMLDAGQGDAILVQSARGRAILIDTGGRLERGLTADGNSPAEAIGERIVVPTLFRMGVTRLDAIILTHPHGEHRSGSMTDDRARSDTQTRWPNVIIGQRHGSTPQSPGTVSKDHFLLTHPSSREIQSHDPMFHILKNQSR